MAVSTTDTERRWDEPRENKRFFESRSHANIGIVDNANWENRDVLQCPVDSAHKISFRRVIHVEQCARKNRVKLKECIYNRFHQFRAEDEEEHYRLCCTWLMISARYRHSYPDWATYESGFAGYQIGEHYSLGAYYRWREDCLDRKPEHPVPDVKFPWYQRKSKECHAFVMSNQMMRDLAISVISEANEIEKADSAGEKSPRKRPNFYNRRPPTLQLPRPPPPPPPSESKKRDKNVRPVREVFDYEGFFDRKVMFRVSKILPYLVVRTPEERAKAAVDMKLGIGGRHAFFGSQPQPEPP